MREHLRKIKAEAEKLGMKYVSFEHSRGPHPKLNALIGSSAVSFAVPFSPSDHRSLDNCVSQMRRLVFEKTGQRPWLDGAAPQTTKKDKPAKQKPIVKTVESELPMKRNNGGYKQITARDAIRLFPFMVKTGKMEGGYWVYLDGWSDKRIGDENGFSEAQIAKFRKMAFGQLRRGDGFTTANSSRSSQVADLNARLERLEERVQTLEDIMDPSKPAPVGALKIT